MSHGNVLRALKEFGVAGTWKQLYQLRNLKFGKLVGTDVAGNQYFENREEYPHGQNRWVVYAGNPNFYTADASNIAPEWHAWMHYVTDEPPTLRTVGSVHRTAPLANAHGSSAPYARNVGGVITRPTPNGTQIRPRAYGLGNGLDWPNGGSKPNAEGYYTQPGYPTDARNGSRFVSERAKRVKFSLKDTPLTLAAKEAAKAGLSLEEYATFTDDDSPTKALLLLTGGNITAAEAKEIAAQAGPGSELLAEGAAGIPESPEKKALALRLAQGGTALPSDAGTFAAEAASTLTPEEEALLSDPANGDLDALLAEAQRWQTTVEDYAHIRARDAQAGVKVAAAKRDAALAKAERLKAVLAKLGALEAKYAAKGEEMAAKVVAELQ